MRVVREGSSKTSRGIEQKTKACKGREEAMGNHARARSGTLPTEPASELEILGLDGNTLGVDSGEVGILEERDKVRLRSLLERHNG
jgi:hypothetical protein